MIVDAEAWWERLLGTQPEPHPAVPLIAAALALIVVFSSGPWRRARNLQTFAHEAGHAVVALLVGRRLRGIRLHSDTSGVTVSRGKRTGPGMVLTTLAGYPAPAVLGLGFSGLIAADLMVMVLLVSALLVLGVLVMVRNAYGVFTVVSFALVLGVVAFVATPDIQAGFVYFITWFLLLGAVRPVFELLGKRRRGTAPDSDADQLARLTGMPAALWVLVLALLAVLCLVVGGAWLLEPALAGIRPA